MKKDWELGTKAIHGGFNENESTGSTSQPIYQSAAFSYASAEELEDVFQGRRYGHVYSRISNPTVSALEAKLTLLVDALGTIAVSSGMAAITTTIMTLAEAGDEIITSKSLFGGTRQLFTDTLERFGITFKHVNATDIEGYKDAITDKSRAIFIETIGNPKLDVPDIEAISAIAQAHNLPLIIDCTLTPPGFFKAKSFGATLRVFSTTKYLSGSGNAVGGGIIDLGTFDWKQSRSPLIKKHAAKFGKFGFIATARQNIVTNLGNCLSPFNAYLLMLGLESLPLRMERHCENAKALADFLNTHPAIKQLSYPGLPENAHYDTITKQFNGQGSGLLTIRLKDKATCYAVMNQLNMVKRVTNLGDAKTLIIHPASTIYKDFSTEDMEEAGVYNDLLRISVGIEDIKDIISDFKQSLGALT